MTTAVGRADIEGYVVGALVELGVERSAIAPETVLDDLEIDSLDLLELCQQIRGGLGIPVRPKDFDGVETVRQVVDVCAARGGRGRGRSA
ncbi:MULTISPECIES: acyl carrier protein [unclassified Streptomyces]|uniref:acyl carrier protein n=1 Tax=unclassified Streptomyces TaxID=2593676 RepID=UPI00278BEB72|nr:MULTISPECIES: acyl carrier protein [unclassified Streptomyces]